MNNKQLNGGGYDVLKYLMALLIVAIHSKAFYGEYSSVFLKPLTEIAVPVFFILSSFFYFLKLNNSENRWSILSTYLKRIGILYMFWFCVNLPVILHYKHYFIQNGIMDIFRLLSDIVLRTTYSGSWFLSATALAIVIYTIVSNSKFVKWILVTLSIALLFYINCIDVIPERMHGFFDLWTTNIRKDANLTVLESLGWVGIGSLLAEFNDRKISLNRKVLSIVSCFLMVLLVLTSNYRFLVCNQLVKIILAIALFLWAKELNLAPTLRLKHLRQLSILYFMIHFNVVRMLGHTNVYSAVGGILFYLIVLLLTHICSELIIYLSNKRYFKWLKYSY